MADQSDVEVALVTLAAGALYPQGTAAPSASGATYRIYRGDPTNAALERDLGQDVEHVTISALQGAQQEIDQIPAIWDVPSPIIPSMTVTVQGATATFSGTVALGQIAGVLVDSDAFVYRTRPGDTLAAVASSLAALVNQVRIATVSEASLIIPGASYLIARVVADQVALMPTRRQRGGFKITCWSADPLARDATASLLDLACSGTHFIALRDGTVGQLRYIQTEQFDELSPLPLYRRTLSFHVDYTTTLIQVQPSMLFGLLANDSTASLTIS